MKIDIPPDKLKELKKKSDIYVWVVIIAIILAVVLIIVVTN
jgi:type IV secretory pathway component VirB8